MSCSLCMIVKNEEEGLGRCLESASGIFDEIIIVDTGSTDSTREIALRFTDKIYNYVWQDDFAAARNYSFSLAKSDYAMWLDGDDYIPPQSKRELADIIAELDTTKPDAVFLPYAVGFDGHMPPDSSNPDRLSTPSLVYERERIIRLASGMRFEGAIHEAISVSGRAVHKSAQIYHLGKSKREEGRNLRIFEGLIKSGKPLSPREKYYYARELCYVKRFEEAKRYYLECFEDESAWSENRVSAATELALMISGESPDEALSLLLKSLTIAPPRADMCCAAGNIFLKKGEYEQAIFWYSLAPSRYSGFGASFISADYGGYIPYLQLTVIYDRLGDKRRAREYNELAGKCRPQGAEYLWNKAYFESADIR